MFSGRQTKHVHYAPLSEPCSVWQESGGTLPAQRSRSFTNLLIIIILSSPLVILVVFLVLGPNTKHSPEVIHCGDSAAQATQHGCHFDIMSFSWLPPPCFDAELTREFESLQAWEWFADPERTQPVAKEEVLRGEADALFVSFEYHRAHCTSMWKKLHRALSMGGFVDSYIGNYNHTAHCAHMLLMKGEKLGALNTIISTKFPTSDSKTVELQRT